MRLAALLVCSIALACSGAPPSTPASLRPSDVVEVSALPPGHEEGKRLSESCRGTRGFRAIDEEPLADVDCSAERLSRVLRARAAERGSRYLVNKQCQVRGQGRPRYSIRCSASLASGGSAVALGGAAPASTGPAPSAEQVRDLDEPRPQGGSRILITFAPAGAGSQRLAPRAYHHVAETAEPAVGRAQVGQVSARCSDCDAFALRHALRVAAGRMGAGEIAAVRCFRDREDERCVGSALEPWSF